MGKDIRKIINRILKRKDEINVVNPENLDDCEPYNENHQTIQKTPYEMRLAFSK